MAAPTPEQVRRGLLVLSADAARDFAAVIRRNPRRARQVLLDAGPASLGYFTGGSSALAVDWFEELRESASPRSAFRPEVYPWRRDEEFARALVWATRPLELGDPDLAEAVNRLGAAVEYEVFDSFTGSIDGNVRADSEAIGWSRNANYGACKFCLMLAGRGAVYRTRESVQFAAHTNCRCTCVPAFRGGDHGPEASVIQYQASQRYRTKAQRDANNARVREYLNQHYADAPG